MSSKLILHVAESYDTVTPCYLANNKRLSTSLYRVSFTDSKNPERIIVIVLRFFYDMTVLCE